MANAKSRGCVLGAVAAASYGLNPLFTLPLYGAGMGVDSVLFYRYLLAAAMLVFLISMLGLPPLFGFLGLVTVLNDLAARHAYWVVIVILVAKLLMAYAYLKVIKTLYFDSRSGMFDRVDKGIYICLILTIALMIAVAVNPRFCLTVLQDFLN